MRKQRKDNLTLQNTFIRRVDKWGEVSIKASEKKQQDTGSKCHTTQGRIALRRRE